MTSEYGFRIMGDTLYNRHTPIIHLSKIGKTYSDEIIKNLGKTKKPQTVTLLLPIDCTDIGSTKHKGILSYEADGQLYFREEKPNKGRRITISPDDLADLLCDGKLKTGIEGEGELIKKIRECIPRVHRVHMYDILT